MSEYIHLIGAEDVRIAANQMRQAADDMRRAANSISDSILAHQRHADEWICRFENAVALMRQMPTP